MFTAKYLKNTICNILDMSTFKNVTVLTNAICYHRIRGKIIRTVQCCFCVPQITIFCDASDQTSHANAPYSTNTVPFIWTYSKSFTLTSLPPTETQVAWCCSGQGVGLVINRLWVWHPAMHCWVSTEVGDRLCTGKPSQYETGHLSQLSLPSLQSR